MKISEFAKLIGQRRVYPIGGIEFDVDIIDVKMSYGMINVQIRPVSGYGLKWVALSSLKI